MKVLLLFPILLVSGISGYNLFFITDTLFLGLMHFGVLLICLLLAGLLVRSMFTIRYVEVEDEAPATLSTEEELTLQHL